MPMGDNNRKVTRAMAVEALLACDGAILPAARWIEAKHGISYTHASMRYQRDKARKAGIQIPIPTVRLTAGIVRLFAYWGFHSVLPAKACS